MSYASADIFRCRNIGHRFRAVWSDKTPLKVSLLCVTCSEISGNSTYVGYGEESKSWGVWRSPAKQEDAA